MKLPKIQMPQINRLLTLTADVIVQIVFFLSKDTEECFKC